MTLHERRARILDVFPVEACILQCSQRGFAHETHHRKIAALGGMTGSAPARRGPGRPPKAPGAVPIRRAAKGGKRSSASMDEMQATLLETSREFPR